MTRLISAFASTAALLCAGPTLAQADACASDLNGDGIVAGADLALVLGSWGPCKTCDGDVNGDHVVDGVDLAFVLTRWGGTCAPRITSLIPSFGPPAGGSTVVLIGDHLAGVINVTFGDVDAAQITVQSSTQLSVVTPPGGGGTVDLSITTLGGSVVLMNGFRYYSPGDWATVLEVDPDPAVVTDAALRKAIRSTDLPWRVRDNATGIEMVLIPPGNFEMGCSPSDHGPCDTDENPVHSVTLTMPFYLGRFEVKQSEWNARTGTNPSRFQGSAYPGSAGRPVETVSWLAARDFATSAGMRLPTEAEWEFAYRAGTSTALHGWPEVPQGTNVDGMAGAIGWFSQNSNGQTNPVGSKAPNGFGIYDMTGNVWEWVADWYSDTYYSASPPTNPLGPTDGTNRALRGSSWQNLAQGLRCSYRGRNLPTNTFDSVGFRVARNP